MTKIAIIGAGIIGSMVAYELSQIEGLEIILIEENQPAEGATGAALGVMMGAISHKTKGRAWKMRQKSLERYETLIPELKSLTGLEIPYNRQGIVRLRFTDEDRDKWQKLARIRHGQGYELEIWNRKTLKERCPQVRNEGIIGAIYSPQDRQVNPTLLTRSLVTGASKNGVNCQFGWKVDNFLIDTSDGSNLKHCTHIKTPKGEINIDYLILTAGIGSAFLTEKLGQKRSIEPVLGQAFQIQLTTPWGREDFQPILTGNDVQIVPLGNGEYWIGATIEFPDERGMTLAEPELLETLKQKAIAFCPQFADGTIICTWSGKRPHPVGIAAPIIEKLPDHDNVILATAHYRNGILLAPATAEIVRDWILEAMIK